MHDPQSPAVCCAPAAPISATPDPAAVRQLADLFHLLGDPTRLAIVLHCRDNLAVSELASRMAVSVSLVSHHLRLLRAARIVKSERSGKQVFYSLQDEHIRHTLGDMLAHVQEPATDDGEGGA
ncbi:metalloregulator ArsR/SmtB family transcription factor [Massilia sp. W12]|uniref:ArsR/SmtB family transcription factor n=1 Tax=Massilia sp. W12 TaxID=3126507 RepID=UPI0030D0E808